MLPVTHSETPQEASTRQSFFISLRTIEPFVPRPLFDQLIAQGSIELPQRVDWGGSSRNLSFEELKTNFSHVDYNFLPQLLLTAGDVSNQQIKNQNQDALSDYKSHQQNLAVAGKTLNLYLNMKQRGKGYVESSQKKVFNSYAISRHERMKTVFGHAQIDEATVTSVYNVQFDKESRFIISGADDGIIKIWDKDTLQLQASLHGHTDVITDLDVSQDNKYIATASKDGKVIVWDLERCTIVDRLPSHSDSVSNVKFYKFQIKRDSSGAKTKDQIQILVTCSEDGTINIYDEHGYLKSQEASQGEAGIQKRTRRHDQTQARKERFQLTLTPEDYRVGSRNKKIDSVNVSPNGLVAAGTNYGEIFLWQLDFNQLQKQGSKVSTWLGSHKKHAKSVHFCDFSPNGKYLFTGSIDGTAKVWNVELEKGKKGDAQRSPIELNEKRLQVTLEEQRRSWQCDCLTWSVFGRYAIASISGTVEKQDNEKVDISVIKVWDSCTNQVITDLARGNNIKLESFSFVLAPHPVYEDYLMTGSGGGLIALWNIKTRQLIKKFTEYGVYSVDKYTLNDPYDGKWCSDGSCFVVGSALGTISLFSNEEAPHKYQQTRVEQFFHFDNQMHENNVYESLEEEPQLCPFNMIPYEVQPPPPQIGKFKNARKLEPIQYERQLVIRQEMAKEEEQFIQSQLEEGLRNNVFNAGEEDDSMRLDEQVRQAMSEGEQNEEAPVRRRRARLDSELSPIPNRNEFNEASQEAVQNIVNRINAAPRQQRGRPRGRGRGRISVVDRVEYNRSLNNPYFDPDNSLYDRVSDENFQIEEDAESEESYQESDGLGDDEDYGLRNNRIRRENYHQLEQDRRQRNIQQLYQDEREEAKQRQEQSRQERALRRQRRLIDEVEEEKMAPRRTRGGARRRNAIQSDEESENPSEEDFQISDAGGVDEGRKRLRRQSKSTKSRNRLPSSSEESFNTNEEDESNSGKPNLQSKRNKRKSSGHSGSNRNARKNERTRYYKMDESSDEEMEVPLKEEEEDQINPRSKSRKRVLEEESDDDKGDSVPMQVDTTNKSSKTKGDEDYELFLPDNQGRISLEEDGMMVQQPDFKLCSFCKRQDVPMIGPFYKFDSNKNPIDGPHYFHKECIEVNNHSFYNKQKNKWMNIGKALDQLVVQKTYECRRCSQTGATIKCTTCDRYYHGFLCSQLYMIFLGKDDYQCFKCRNKANHRQYSEKPPSIDEYEARRHISREYLLQSKLKPDQAYIPQINDMVYYFFQGHEKFISDYNCYFYMGENFDLGFNYPWKVYQDLLIPTLCKVINISHTFPSINTLHLIKMFGRGSSNVDQVPQIITHLQLQLAGQPDKKFNIDIFPNDLPDFLILNDVYEQAKERFSVLKGEQQVVGHTFKAKCKNFKNVKVVDVHPKEPTLFPDTDWEIVQYLHQEQYALRNRGRRSLRRAEEEEKEQIPSLMNYWELQLLDPNEEVKGAELSAFQEDEKQRLLNVLREQMSKKADLAEPFKERVPTDIAEDYRCHISAEMYLNLILSRLENDYYRTQDQLFFDLDLISYNAIVYNGEACSISRQAKKFIETIRCELKRQVNSAGHKKQPREEVKEFDFNRPAGKLTAPSRIGYSSMETFLRNQEDDLGRQRSQLEETKKTESKRNGYKSHQLGSMQTTEEELQEDYQEPASTNDFKVPSRAPAQTLQSRRQTRHQQRLNYNEALIDQTIEAGEKVFQADETQERGTNLGKRTRRNRQRLDDQTFEEGEDDDELEKTLRQHEQGLGMNGSSNKRYPKRLRN